MQKMGHSGPAVLACFVPAAAVGQPPVAAGFLGSIAMSDSTTRSAAAPSPAGSAYLTACAGLLVLAVAMGIGRFAFTPVLPMMLEDAGLTIAQGGLLASANYAGYLLGALSATLIRIRAETAIRAGLAAIVLTTLAMGLQLPLEAWMAMRLAAGVASAWILISVSAWSLGSLARLGMPALGSVVFAGVGTGIALAGIVCIILVRMHADSTQAWIALGTLAAVIAALVWRVFSTRGSAGADPVRPADAGPPARRPYRWDAYSIRLVVCYGVFGFGYIIPATFLPVMARQALQDPSLFGWSWPIFGAAAALSTLAVSRINAFISNRGLWVACHLIMAAGVALPALRPGLGAVLVAALLVGGTFMVLTLCAMQEAKRVAAQLGQDATVLIGAMTSAFALGQILGPLTVSSALGKGGFGPALLLAAALMLASGAAMALKPRAPTDSGADA
jgi:predicted MFS family arabinose efflux permease